VPGQGDLLGDATAPLAGRQSLRRLIRALGPVEGDTDPGLRGGGSPLEALEQLELVIRSASSTSVSSRPSRPTSPPRAAVDSVAPGSAGNCAGTGFSNMRTSPGSVKLMSRPFHARVLESSVFLQTVAEQRV